MRDHWEDFVKFLKDNKDFIDPVIYTTALSPYTSKLIDIIDPQKEVFKTFLFQNACYIFEIKEENVLYLVKDISRFRNRDIRRSIIIDPKPINFMMTPENAIPATEYTAEYHEPGSKDPHLLMLIDELDELKDLEDVRPYL